MYAQKLEVVKETKYLFASACQLVGILVIMEKEAIPDQKIAKSLINHI